jgi:hypothetical protein
VENKPFTIQSPEEIAKDYGGNKQKIAEAMQMGIVDPTAGTLAGMFIDRMRSAAQMEGAPQQTVAEQVFAPPAPPMGAPMGAPAGLGATPEAAAMPLQEMGPPPQEMAPPQDMPSMAEGGMVPPYASGGGLSDVPIPDGMFDEPSNGGFGDGYAGGGMVAFAPGGSTGDFIEQTALSRFPGLQITGRARTQARNAEVGGVPDSFHRIDAARDVRVPPGMTKAEFIAQLKGTFGDDYDILPSKGNSVHIEPGPALGRKVRGGKELAGAAQADNTLYGLPTNLFGNVALAKSMIPEQSAEDLEYRKELAESLSPERRKQDKKDAFFEGLGKLAGRLGASKNPSFLGGVAENLGPGAGDITESLDEAAKRVREMQRERSALANATRKEQMDAVAMGFDLTGKVAQLDQGIQAQKADLAIKREELQMRKEEFNTRRYEAQQAAVAAGLKFDLDQYLVTEINAGGERAKNAQAFMVARYGDKGSDAGPFTEKLKDQTGAKQNPAFKY